MTAQPRSGTAPTMRDLDIWRQRPVQRPAADARRRIHIILATLGWAGAPGAVTPRVLLRRDYRKLRSPQHVYADPSAVPAVYPLGPLSWLWDAHMRSVRSAGLTVRQGLLVCLPEDSSGQTYTRWRPTLTHPATAVADLLALVAQLEHHARRHHITVPESIPDAVAAGGPAREWIGDARHPHEPDWERLLTARGR